MMLADGEMAMSFSLANPGKSQQEAFYTGGLFNYHPQSQYIKNMGQ